MLISHEYLSVYLIQSHFHPSKIMLYGVLSVDIFLNLYFGATIIVRNIFSLRPPPKKLFHHSLNYLSEYIWPRVFWSYLFPKHFDAAPGNFQVQFSNQFSKIEKREKKKATTMALNVKVKIMNYCCCRKQSKAGRDSINGDSNRTAVIIANDKLLLKTMAQRIEKREKWSKQEGNKMNEGNRSQI